MRDARPADRAPDGPDEIEIAGGSFILGATDEPWAYDNELVPHEVELRPFLIDRAPVTNGDFAEFVDAGGYGDAEVLERGGLGVAEREDASAPLHWERADGGWERRHFGHREPLPLDEPVQHVCWYEAEALRAGRASGCRPRPSGSARRPGTSGGGRAATRGGAVRGTRRTSAARASPRAGRLVPGRQEPEAASSSPATCGSGRLVLPAYPGFLSFPYPEYSEVFFGETYRVLRGGSWATDPLVARGSFRNWEYPDRRHIFAGFRCAR